MMPSHSLIDSGGSRRGLIRLTPLIDIVFILVVFFMLAASFSQWRTIELTTPGRTVAGASMEGALLVEIESNGNLRLSGKVISHTGLKEEVARRVESRPGLRLLVRPATGVSLQQAVQVLDIVVESGVSDISLIRHSNE